MRNSNGWCLYPVAVVILAVASLRADTCLWSNVTAGTYYWTNEANWAESVVPPNDGTADIVFSNSMAGVATPYTVMINGNRSINRLKFLRNGVMGSKPVLSSVDTNTLISLGAGGLALDSYTGAAAPYSTDKSMPSPNWYTPLHLTASQSWFVEQDGYEHGHLHMYMRDAVSSGEDVLWTIGGRTFLSFLSGHSSNFLGRVVLNGRVNFANPTQFSRLGTRPIQVTNVSNLVAEVSVPAPVLRFSHTASGSFFFNNALEFALTNASTVFGLNLVGDALDITLQMTNTWSGITLDDKLNVTGPTVFSDTVKLILSGDNKELVTNNAARIWLQNVVTVLNHTNAWGPQNSMRTYLGKINSQIAGTYGGLLATDGKHVASVISAPSPGQGIAGGVDQYVKQAQHPTMPLLVGLSGPGSVTFSGALSISGTFPQEHQFRLTAPSNGLARFTGTVTGGTTLPVQILGLGDVGLYATNTAMKQGVYVRNGRLLLGSEKDAAGTKPIVLGDVVPVSTNVRLLAAVNPATVSGDAWSTNETSGTYTFKTSAPNVDGVKPVTGDRILVNEPANAYRNGIYLMTASNIWTRAEDLNETNEFVHGLRVKVAEGSAHAGKALFLFNYEDMSPLNTKFILNWSNHYIAFHYEAEAEPKVAVLTDGAVTVTNAINVVDNKSAGRSLIGGNTADESVFTGNIALSRSVTLSAVQSGLVRMTGAFTGSGDIIKAGAGTVRLTGADSAVGGYVLEEGTLAFGQPVTIAKPLTFTATNGRTGTLAVSGNLTFGDGAALASVPAGLDPALIHTLVQCSGGTIQGTLPVQSLPLDWHVHQSETAITTYYAPGGTVFHLK